jgi:hypothetical protein
MHFYKLIIIFSCVIAQLHLSLYANAQGKVKSNLYEIQYINIENNSIVSVVKQLIEQHRTKNTLFRNGYGYITVDNIDFRSYNILKGDFKDLITNNDTLISFNINLSSYYINGNKDADCFNCDYYPPFYTFIDNTLVLIYDNTFKWIFTSNGSGFSSKSKKKLTAKIKKALRETLNDSFLFYDPFQDKKYTLNKKDRELLTKDKIMSMGAFTFHSGQSVSILRNGDIKTSDY